MRTVYDLQSATRCEPREIPKGETLPQNNGRRFQNSLERALRIACDRHGAELIPEPWFEYLDTNGLGRCAPDFIIELGAINLVIEAKLTFVPEAITKLHGLYLPVAIVAASNWKTRGLVICRNTTPAAPAPVFSITAALTVRDSVAVMLWRGGPVEW